MFNFFFYKSKIPTVHRTSHGRGRRASPPRCAPLPRSPALRRSEPVPAQAAAGEPPPPPAGRRGQHPRGELCRFPRAVRRSAGRQRQPHSPASCRRHLAPGPLSRGAGAGAAALGRGRGSAAGAPRTRSQAVPPRPSPLRRSRARTRAHAGVPSRCVTSVARGRQLGAPRVTCASRDGVPGR